MAPVIVAQIYGAVNLQEAEDQGVTLHKKCGGGGWARMRKISLTWTCMTLYAIDCGLRFGDFCLKGNMKKQKKYQIPDSEAAGKKLSSIGFNRVVR